MIRVTEMEVSYFNSQPHKEADGKTYGGLKYCIISTHSLTRRLTLNYTRIPIYCAISTHSLTRRLTS